MRNDIRFSLGRAGSDRVYHVDEIDIGVVLARLPSEVSTRLQAVHFNDRSRGGRVLGYVTHGRREIVMCALPPRLSFTRFLAPGQTAEEFGATRGAQWPMLAIRRFLLYDVFLHELGHLQLVHPKSASERRKFAVETKAQEFAMRWCKILWSRPFDHPDPVHNPPTAAERQDPHPEITALMARVQRRPEDAELFQKLGKEYRRASMIREAKAAFERAIALDSCDSWSCLYLGNCFFTEHDLAEAINWFKRAARLMPERAVAYWCLAEAYERQGDIELADTHYRKAVEVEPKEKTARTKLKLWQARSVG